MSDAESPELIVEGEDLDSDTAAEPVRNFRWSDIPGHLRSRQLAERNPCDCLFKVDKTNFDQDSREHFLTPDIIHQLNRNLEIALRRIPTGLQSNVLMFNHFQNIRATLREMEDALNTVNEYYRSSLRSMNNGQQYTRDVQAFMFYVAIMTDVESLKELIQDGIDFVNVQVGNDERTSEENSIQMGDVNTWKENFVPVPRQNAEELMKLLRERIDYTHLAIQKLPIHEE